MNQPTSSANRFEACRQKLLAATSDRDRMQVIEQLISDYVPYIQMLARPRLTSDQRSRFDSEDIRQSICWRVADGLRDGRLELLSEGQFRQLLKTMVRNLVMDRSAKRFELPLDTLAKPSDSLDPTSGIPDSEPTASTRVSMEELRRLLWMEIEEHLQPDEFYLFRAYHLEGRDYASLSGELALTVDAVRMRLQRAREKLKARLQRFEELFDS